MMNEYNIIPFERFADDIVVHCKSKAQAEFILKRIAQRLREWKLELHPEKTRIVYCKDSNRPGKHTHVEFDFLGFTFKQRQSRNAKGQTFGGFLPAISKKAQKKLSADIRAWQLQRRTDLSISQLADLCNPQIRGWDYYGMFYPTKFHKVLRPINYKLAKWVRRKYRKNKRDAWAWLIGVQHRAPTLFAHWTVVLGTA